MDILTALLTPATETRTLTSPPAVRRTVCAKCPFGSSLTPAEQAGADIIKARIAGERSAGKMTTVWGCHETIRGERPQVCAGFVEWVRERPELEA